ncbi:MAG: DNA cytosine methyltransferase [Caulobacteraceae bacterium]|nr:DNA cytosine methyltransferase [Caulobacteraceae bacterium]
MTCSARSQSDGVGCDPRSRRRVRAVAARDALRRGPCHDVHGVGSVAVPAAGGIRGGRARAGAACGEGGVRIGSLFSGIGGLELGVEHATGGHVVWQVEKEPFCRAVLAKHWPHAVRHDDVCAVGSELAAVDVVCGGFPCQDVSVAGKRAGFGGERSSLWREYRRVVALLRPRFVFVENVPGLVSSRGGWDFAEVLGDLASLGYDARWDRFRAADVGAPHRRERVFLLAYAASEREREPTDETFAVATARRTRDESRVGGELANPAGIRCGMPQYAGGQREESRGDAGTMDNTNARRWGESATGEVRSGEDAAVGDGVGVDLVNPNRECGEERDVRAVAVEAEVARASGRDGRNARCLAQPRMGRRADGVSARLDAHRWPAGPGEPQHKREAPRVTSSVKDRAARLRALGNAVVPQVAAFAWQTLYARHVVRSIMEAV